jgi:hypothetical protein
VIIEKASESLHKISESRELAKDAAEEKKL